MKPSEKSDDIDMMLETLTGVSRRKSIIADVCTMCGKPAAEFRDELSKREYTISGMCQKCQDKVFGQ